MNLADLQTTFEALLSNYNSLETDEEPLEEFIYKSLLHRSGDIRAAEADLRALKQALHTFA